MADASGYSPVVATKRVRPRVEALPWPADKRLVRARFTASRLRRLLAEIETGDPESLVHQRALQAAEVAASTLWGPNVRAAVDEAAADLRALSIQSGTYEKAIALDRVNAEYLAELATRTNVADGAAMAADLWPHRPPHLTVSGLAELVRRWNLGADRRGGRGHTGDRTIIAEYVGKPKAQLEKAVDEARRRSRKRRKL